ncbi:MAG: TIGR03619 family F420-dependent LLM class oxidoreductase [Armatimonadetes bacterium]|nr:TIGR03619 family F420-dependent LLM class oxidoreductase [Armatimonadota bacterium]
MHWGLSIPHFKQVASPKAIRDVARHAEELGFDSLWVTDHVAMPEKYVPRFGEVIYEPLTALAYAAAVTSRIKLGSSVIILPYRNPVVTAKVLATIDVLSEGRLIVGGAAGWCEEEFAALGVSHKERGDLSDEYLALFKTLWTEHRPSFNGRYIKFPPLVFEPKPVQKPHPPLWVGGNSRRGLRRAARFGNVWHPTRPTVQMIKEGVEYLKKIAPKYGRDGAAIGIAARHPLRFMDAPSQSGMPLLGPKDYIVENLKAMTAAGVSALMVDLFYSVPELDGETVTSMMKTMDRIATEVRPQVQ